MKTLPSLLALVAMLFSPLQAAGPVIVHEWGTFTSLQDENGKALGGINVDDEPAPPFVYFAGRIPVLSPTTYYGSFGLPPYGQLQEEGSGAIPFGSAAVTLRLETPVVYIYPPQGMPPASVPPLQVHVDFHGGILGQYYPYARIKGLSSRGTELTGKTTTSLDWKVRQVGTPLTPIATTDKVWTTPREVSAPTLAVESKERGIKSGKGRVEAEKFLFYRGLGHLDSPIRLSRDLGVTDAQAKITVLAQKGSETASSGGWLADIRADGTCAFRAVPAFASKPGQTLAEIPSQFEAADFSATNLTALTASMQEALVREGLYADEASAMLRTWEVSYFKSPGLRFFYIVPSPWVNEVLPLKITGAPTEITRVMVGRIELVTASQQAALKRLAAGPCPDLQSVRKAAFEVLQKGTMPREEMAAYYRGEKSLATLGIALPPEVQDYLSLGRFRDALIVHEQQQNPTPALAQFIKINQLGPVN